MNVLGLLLKEASRRMLLMATLFVVVASVGLVIGLLWPKTWECTAVLEPDAGAINRLMEGRLGGKDAQQSHLASMIQAVQTRKILREILEFGGWLANKPAPPEEEILLAQLWSRLRLEASRDGKIKIAYRDSDSARTFRITSKVVEILIREAATSKETASRETYEFVERQVKEYSSELTAAHEKLLAYYRGQSPPVAGADPEEPAPRERREKSPSPRASAEEIAALRAEEATLTAQLARTLPTKPSTGESSRAEEQMRARVQQMRLEYEHLANSYTEQHPDVVRKKMDLDDARNDLQRLEAARVEEEKARAATTALDADVGRAARVRLEEVQALLAAAGHPSASGRSRRPRSALPVPAAEVADPEMRQVGQDSKLSELLRRYETTRDVYQDLLKKRETARLSLNLDVERSHVILRVLEPPRVPVIATGLRVLHRSIIGLTLAMLVPLGVVLALVSLDGRVRNMDQIERTARLPILVSIPYAASAEGHGRARWRKLLSLSLVASVFVAYFLAYLLTRTKVGR